MVSTRDWLWYFQVALEGKEVIFALNAKGSFLLTMVKFSNLILSHHNYLHLIFYQLYPSLQGGMASRRKKCKMTYNFPSLYLKIMDFRALCFKIKSIAR